MPIKDNTNQVLNAVDKKIVSCLRESALSVERTAKEPGYCPVKTSTARRSIVSNWYKSGSNRAEAWPAIPEKGIKAGKTSIDSQTEKKAIIGSNVEYFPYIEMGTRKMSARAPLRRALEANWDKIKMIFKGT